MLASSVGELMRNEQRLFSFPEALSDSALGWASALRRCSSQPASPREASH